MEKRHEHLEPCQRAMRILSHQLPTHVKIVFVDRFASSHISRDVGLCAHIPYWPIEWGSPGVSLEQILNAYAVMGGRVAITELPPHTGNGAKKGTLKGKKKNKAHGR
jgi:hypothetical protein